ncbi:MAG: class I SAM-dependent methyltransferase [Sphingomonadaceae bacterium]|uniref:class I SAM-dependent methyltransferase n=1 Tax=Thermaurantiacus sp. TaxID=2820283 RepID=UPI00298F0FC3|nr:class I SAM-dependent methyltransferase [Thermaurantiacus sp.]MCS6987296.1 class I SAM-dependent methyltransferase [Sphingomonadaceae bacterium]MDW8414516.1 class I SAM-dependent methyltransferase [Thermaurantiacus sp.]
MNWWDAHVVPRLIGFACTQPPVMRRRALVVPQAEGRVLELGAGGGANLPLYDPRRVTSVTGVDPHARLRAMALRAGVPAAVPIELVDGRAEELPFPDGSFDTVVTTFTLCSVQDPARALAEARRVLKPGGRLVFLEHGLAPAPGLQRWQRRLEPLWKRIAGGCHLTRPVAASIARAGFTIDTLAQEFMERAPKVLGWVERGVARPA